MSRVRKKIRKPLSSYDDVTKIVKEDIRFLLGNEKKIDFQNDQWIERVTLKEHFPRVFALAFKKCENIEQFGEWVKDIWKWQIDLRRNLFGWEAKQWAAFLKFRNMHHAVSTPLIHTTKVYLNLIMKQPNFGRNMERTSVTKSGNFGMVAFQRKSGGKRSANEKKSLLD